MKSEMRNWKQLEIVKKAHQDLYDPSDPNNPDSDTFLTLIIKSVFFDEEERIQVNGIWIQAVLEIIFDENHLSSKIDSDAIDSWIQKLSGVKRKEKVKYIIYRNFLILFF